MYVSLQGMQEGQGAATHVAAVRDGLDKTDDVVVCAPPAGRRATLVERLANVVALQRQAAHRARNADVVYLRHHPLLLPLTLWLRGHRIPVVQEVNGPLEDYGAIYPFMVPFTFLLRRASSLALMRSDRVIAVSTRLKDYLELAGVPPASVVVVPNGADLRRFTPRSGPPGGYAVFVGALTPWQGLDTLAQATWDPAWPSGVRLVVAGDGPSSEALQGADPNVLDRRGVVPHDQVGPLMSGALVTLSPKTVAARWSSPLKVYESVACGTPIVATDVGEQGDLIRSGGYGLLVRPGDPAALAKAVSLVATDGDTRDALVAAAITARDSVSWDRRVRAIREVLSNVTRSATDRTPLTTIVT